MALTEVLQPGRPVYIFADSERDNAEGKWPALHTWNFVRMEGLNCRIRHLSSGKELAVPAIEVNRTVQEALHNYVTQQIADAAQMRLDAEAAARKIVAASFIAYPHLQKEVRRREGKANDD